MKWTIRFRRFLAIFVQQLAALKTRLAADWQYQQLISNLGKYIPKAFTITPWERAANRRRAMRDPKYCTHRKGGRILGAIKDYNVTMHTFPDNTTRIRCNGCGAKWFKGRFDWEEALKMMDSSTNTETRSEIVSLRGISVEEARKCKRTFVNDPLRSDSPYGERVVFFDPLP